MAHTTDGRARATLLALLLMVSLVTLALPASADPTGANFNSNSTGAIPTNSPSSITNNRSTITTVVLSAVQQDSRWKAYVGNVTGSLTLDDASSNTIYDWSALSVPTGEVYASRSGSVSFASPQCAQAGTITAEETALNMTGTEADSINNTFNGTDHTPTLVAGQTLSSCQMTSLYVNDASQGQTSTADFQEFLMEDATSSLIYVSIINDNKVGFDGKTYDFQMIVAESNVEAAHPYYFYIELG